MDRRTFNKVLAGTGALFGLNLPSLARADDRQIRMIEAGGLSGDAVEAGYIKPFTAKTGIKVVRESPNELGKLRALVQSGRSSTVIFELGAPALFQAKALGLLEKLDWDKIDPLPMFPDAKDEYGIGYQYWSMMMTWRSGVKAPKTWADFFNYRDFPGKRALPHNPAYALPPVLLAAGVPADKLYPLDVELAFRKLEAIKSGVSVWWKAFAQPPQLLRDNEVQYAIASSGRTTGVEGIDFTFNQAAAYISYFGIVKGAKKDDIEAAYKFFHELTDPKNQLAAIRFIPYTGNSPELEAMLPEEKLKFYTTSSQNRRLQYHNDNEWWYKNADSVQKRWQEFLLTL